MKRLDINTLKREYIDKTYNWLTVIDVLRESSIIKFVCRCKCGSIVTTRKSYVLSNHTTSCGCYKRSKEKAEKFTQWCKNNPDKVADQASRYSQWCKDNPDKVAAKTETRRKTFESNPEIQRNINKNIRQHWKDHPEELKEKSSRQAITLYLKTDYSYLEQYKHIIHPDDYAQVFSRLVTDIRIKCPICGNYETHSFCNVFANNIRGLKPGRRVPMCSRCRSSQYSSYTEKEIADFISTFYSGEYTKNSRNIIYPFELDLYYPEKKIAVEFNGDYWHNSKHCDELYHYNKFKMCLENDITLVSIYESEWRYCQNNIRNYLIDLFNNRSNSLSIIDDCMRNDYPDPNLIVDNSYIEYKLYHRDNFCYTSGLSKVIGRKYEY